MKQLSLLIPLIVLILSPEALAATLSGKLLERGTRKPLPDVNVFVLPHKLKATTDETGFFRIENVPAGAFQWVVNLADYEKLEENDSAGETDLNRTLYLEKSSYNVFETTIVGRRDKKDLTTKTLEAKDFAQMPGAGGDPIKASQNLPGINRPQAYSSQVIIQGSAPGDTRYTIDGHEVPIIFHFGGLSSVVIPEAIERVDTLTAGYGPEHGRAMGGLVGVWTRDPKTDRTHGLAYVDLFNAGAMIEGKLGKDSSYLLGARQSYIGVVLKQIAKKSKDFDLTVAPDFKDLTGEFKTRLTDRDEFKIVSVASQDRLEFLLSQPVNQDPAIRGKFSNQTSFFRLIPQLTHEHSARSTTRASLGLGRDFVKVEIGDDYFYLRTWATTLRVENEQKWNSRFSSYFGIDDQFTWATVDLNLPVFYTAGGVPNPLSTGTTRRVSVKGNFYNLGAYVKNSIKLTDDSRWTLLPNLRADYFSSTEQLLPAPRLAAKYSLTEYTTLKAATGLYYQPPTEQQVSKTVGNPNLSAPSAIHFMAGVEKDFREGASRGFIWNHGPFLRLFNDLVVPSTKFVERDGSLVSENFSNAGKGKAFGYESLLRAEFAPWTAWAGYTLSRSTRTQPGQPEFVSQYDQTHNLNLMGSVDLPRNWRIASRFRYVTGNPTTPISGAVFDADNDVYIPIRGAYYSDRLEPFYQLDLRVDKKWIYNTWILSLYLDVQNVTNHKSVESVQYSYDYSKKQNTTGLPILPTFGLRGEF